MSPFFVQNCGAPLPDPESMDSLTLLSLQHQVWGKESKVWEKRRLLISGQAG
jgi:hypothetical protein